MSESLKLTIYGEPVAKGRPKHGVIKLKSGQYATDSTGRPITTTYTPTKTKQWENNIRLQAISQIGKHELWDEPLVLSITFYRTMPKSMPKKRRATALPTTKPDLKNLIASVEDALNGIAWKDDSQIVHYGDMKKLYGDPPRIEIEVKAIKTGETE